MLNSLISFLSSLKMTVVSGVCIAASLALALAGAGVPADPAWAAVAISGFPIMYAGVYGLFAERRIYTALLITIAMIASIAIGELFAAGEIAFIMAIGGILEGKTIERAQKGLKNLISLAPVTGRKVSGACEEVIPADEIKTGDILRILPGEAVPADGEIIYGDTSVDQSIMTGESLPVDKCAGDGVFCGTINRFGSIDVRVTAAADDSSLQKLIRMVRDAEADKAPTQRIVDKWASWLVPAALCIAAVTLIATGDIVRAVTVLVVFCPCALVLATPVSIVAAIGQATKHGIIIKSGDALERMGGVDMVAFDKTGTLTHGSLSVSDIVPLDGTYSIEDILALAASAESRSEHPLGKAVCAYAEARGLIVKEAEDFKMLSGREGSIRAEARGHVANEAEDFKMLPGREGSVHAEAKGLVVNEAEDFKMLQGREGSAHAEARGPIAKEAEDFKMLPGRGVSANVDGQTVLCGSSSWLSDSGVVFDASAQAALDDARRQGKAVIAVAAGGRAIGIIALSDTLRASSAAMIGELKGAGTGAALLTGDHGETAHYFAGMIGISEVHAGLLPEQKVEKIHELRRQGHSIAMIGDGVNDAPALKAANIGVAMGGMGSDIAVEAADIALMGDDIGKIPYLKRLSNATVRLIKFNITLAMCVNFAAICLSVAGVLNPVTGALWHNAASILVVLNAARLYDRKFV